MEFINNGVKKPISARTRLNNESVGSEWKLSVYPGQDWMRQGIEED